MHILDDLKFRGLLNQCNDFDILYQELKTKCILYCGFDVTADSLHIGNLLPLVCLKRFQKLGHSPIILVGDSTSLVGDPSGKKLERKLNSEETVNEWSKKIKKQIKLFFGDSDYKLVSNQSWSNKLNFFDFIRDIGKHFPIGYMLAKESVHSRLESGISFTEFSYMLIQAYDFFILNKKYDCRLQIGGSDQWGNITAGIDLIRKKRQKKAFGLTIPLVLKSDGSKFGKTESGTIWLDPKKTSPYKFYQFWINTSDQDIMQFLKYFTFLSAKEIITLEEKVKNNPNEREAQHILASKMTEMIHGEDVLKKVKKITNALFGNGVRSLSINEIEDAFDSIPSYTIDNQNKVQLVDILVHADISPSKRQAHEDIRNKSIHINGVICLDVGKYLTSKDRLFNQYTIIRRGKKKYFLIKWK